MLDPREHRKSVSAIVGDYQPSLERLYERFDAIATGRAQAYGVDLHQRILDRLAANGVYASAAGWTACALERDGGSGRLRLVGLAPSAVERSVVPDWTAGVAAAALAQAGAADRAVRRVT
jgi:hypothetical protein